MSRALLIALLALGCGAPAPTRVEPGAGGDAPGDTSAGSEGARATEDAWAAACDGESAATLTRFRALALEEARARGDRARAGWLEAWAPADRGRGSPVVDRAVREVATGVVRRALAICGERAAIAMTRELVRFQTVAAIAPPAENLEHIRMATFLEEWAGVRGLAFRMSGEHDAWEIELPGRSPERSLAYVFHGDVVPVNDPPRVIERDAIPEGWTVAPFDAQVRDGRLYGRGTEDDKGPLAAAMVVLEAIAAAGIEPDGSIVLAIGTAEEEDWDGMRRYASTAPRARHVISVDSNYPVVVAESGFVAWGVRAPVRAVARRERDLARIVAANGGLFLTQVPDRAEMIVVAGQYPIEHVAWLARDAIARVSDDDPAVRGDVEAIEHEGAPALRVVVHGRSTHASVPEEGVNAIWALARVAQAMTQRYAEPPDDAPASALPPFDPLSPPRFGGSAPSDLLLVIAQHLAGDHRGERLGLGYEDELMGPVAIAPTVLRTDAGEVRLEINMRRPQGLGGDEFRARLDAALARLRVSTPALTAIDGVHVGDPHVADLDGDLVPTLMSIWRAHSGDRGALPRSIRGGTYARLFEGAVDFGPSLPGRPYTGHGADEYLELEALRTAIAVTYDATLRLTGCVE